ncbi:MAG: cation diffusion facilitator family transporter [Desulfuromonadales bacterium]|nr:cation diffusion facilitator family transporter [Desulfuromonadales bacterium]
MERNLRFRDAEKIIQIGFWINAFLMVMKLLAGYFGNSQAVFADGIESGCDFIGILAAMIALRMGRKPYDKEHPYGHGRAESISAIVVSLIIFITGGVILYSAVIKIITKGYQRPELIAVAAAVITIIIKEWLYRFSAKRGKKLESPAVLAVAQDHRKDAITSIATLVGVTAAFFGIGIMDPIAAGITALFIFHIGWKIFKESSYDIMDGAPEDDTLQKISGVILEIHEVKKIAEIKGRRSGQYIIVDLKLEMDPEISVKKAHDISMVVKKRIFENFENVGDVMIHVDPYGREEQNEKMSRL